MNITMKVFIINYYDRIAKVWLIGNVYKNRNDAEDFREKNKYKYDYIYIIEKDVI